MAKRKENPKITPRGKGLLGMSMLSIILGSLVGVSLLVQVGIFGIFVVILCYRLSIININGIHFIRRLPRAVFSGVDFEFQIEVLNNRRFFGSKNIIVYDHFLSFAEKGVAIDYIPAGQRIAEVFKSRIIERGLEKGRGYRIVSDFPLGLFEISKRRRDKETVLVYPRPMLPRRLESVALGYGQSNYSSPTVGSRQGEIAGVREFQKGDKISQVLWSKYAKNSKLLVRDYDFPAMEKLSIVFHSYCPSGKLIWPEVFEHSMSLVAGLLLMCRDMGIPFELFGPFTSWRKIECNDPRNIEKFLSLLSYAKHEPESELDKISELLMSIGGNHPIFLISEQDVKLWESKLPKFSRVIHCVDNKSLKSIPPSLELIKRVA